MGKKIDMIGRRYGRLIVESEVGRSGSGSIRYLCKCDCGKEKEVDGTLLRNGQSKSCGCYNYDVITKYGNAVYKEKLYSVWNSIKDRCRNKNNKAYKNYGGRGIRICQEWENDYNAFKTWAYENGYSDRMWIDRIDNDGNYCPSNCRWATAKEQARNKRTTHKIRYKDKYICLTDAAELSGIKFATLKRRLDLGWTQDRLFEPVHTEYSHSDEIRKAIQKTRIEG